MQRREPFAFRPLKVGYGSVNPVPKEKNMLRKISICTALVLTLSYLPTTLMAQGQQGTVDTSSQGQQEQKVDIASLESQARAAYEAEDWQRFAELMLALHQERPYKQEYMYDLVRAYALLDWKTEAYNLMLRMQNQGLSVDFNQTEDSVNIRKTELYIYLNNLMIDAANPAGIATEVLRLQAPPQDISAIAWDPSRNRFLIGTVREGAVMAVAEDGSTELLMKADAANGLWSVSGLAVDPKNNRLWISSASTPAFKDYLSVEQNRGALFEFNLETLAPVGRYNAPVANVEQVLGSVAVTDDQHVYVIDRAMPLIYRKTPDGDRLMPYVGSEDLVGLRDIAVTPDNSRVFVADTARGIFVIDPVAQQTSLMAHAETLNLGGIEAIEYLEGHLLITQPEMHPQRLMRLQLDATGAAVQNVNPMAVAMPGFDRPGRGTLRDGSLYYLANAGSESASETIVMRSEPDAGDTIGPPDIKQLQRALRERRE